MTTECTPWMRALKRIASSLARHKPVRREKGIGSTCKNPDCNGVIFLTLNQSCRQLIDPSSGGEGRPF